MINNWSLKNNINNSLKEQIAELEKQLNIKNSPVASVESTHIVQKQFISQGIQVDNDLIPLDCKEYLNQEIQVDIQVESSSTEQKKEEVKFAPESHEGIKYAHNCNTEELRITAMIESRSKTEAERGKIRNLLDKLK